MKYTMTSRSLLANKTEQAVIINKRDGLYVKKIKDPYYNRPCDFVREFIRQCIDMDTWNNSWHNKIESTPESKRKLISLIDEKIAGRKAEIEKLEFCRAIIPRYDECNIRGARQMTDKQQMRSFERQREDACTKDPTYFECQGPCGQKVHYTELAEDAEENICNYCYEIIKEEQGL